MIVALGLAHAAYFIDYVNDDAYITFRYSRFLASGRGPYFNPGEHVEGYTNFLLMLAVAAGITVGGEGAAAGVAKGIGIVSAAGAAALAYALCFLLRRRDGQGPFEAGLSGLLAAGLVVLSPAFALNSVSGLETALFSVEISAGVFLGIWSADSGRWRLAGLAFAAALLTRPEGAVVFAAYGLAQAAVAAPRLDQAVRDVWRSGRAALGREAAPVRHLLLDGAIVGVAFFAHTAFRLIAYDGEWLPNTYYAKAGGAGGGSATAYVMGGLGLPFLGAPGLIAGLAGWLLLARRSLRSLPVFAVGAAGALLPYLTGTDWMPGWRLVVPYLPLAAVVVSLGWCEAAARLVRGRLRSGSLLALASLPALWLTQQQAREEMRHFEATRARGYALGHRSLAEWLRATAAPGDSIALMDIGIVGYLCHEQRILDITGLTDRQIAKSPGPFLAKQYAPEVVLQRKPEYIVLVFAKAGGASALPEPSELWPWTAIEGRIWRHPLFQAHYVDAQRPPAADSLDRLAAAFGAERAFRHAHPGLHYLLLVFRRNGREWR